MMDKRLAEIHSICENVTEGEWTAVPLNYGDYSIEAKGLYIQAHIKYEDARFIASSRQLIPELLDHVEGMRKHTEVIFAMYESTQKELNMLKQTLREALGE